MSSDIYPDRKTIAIILSVFVPGGGHIYWGQISEWKQTRNGIIIIVSTVVVGIIGNIVASIIASTVSFSAATEAAIYLSIITIGPALIWIWQILNLLKILDIKWNQK